MKVPFLLGRFTYYASLYAASSTQVPAILLSVYEYRMFNWAAYRGGSLIITLRMKKDINRIKVVLVEKKRTNKWLAEQLQKDPGTVSKWCTNTMQPNVETLVEIARCLDVDIKDLFRPIDEISGD